VHERNSDVWAKLKDKLLTSPSDIHNNNFTHRCYAVIYSACQTKGTSDPTGQQDPKILMLITDLKLWYEIQQLFTQIANQAPYKCSSYWKLNRSPKRRLLLSGP
jgi:hypothetical protein